MQINKTFIRIGLLPVIVALAGCVGFVKGFEYQTRTTLDPVNGSGVSGSAVMGYALDGTNFRVRIGLHGLARNVEYQVQFFDAAGCSERDLVHANRIDGVQTDFHKGKIVWAFDNQPVSLTDSFLGTVKKEFRLNPLLRSRFDSPPLDMYPAIVIYALMRQEGKAKPRLEQVACGKISSTPVNLQPHT